MKKIGLLFLVVLSVFLIAGCGSSASKGGSGKKSIFDTKKTMSCVKEEFDSDGYKTISNYLITYTSKKVTKVDTEQIMEMDPEIIDWVYSFGYDLIENMNLLDGIEASYTKSGYNTITMKLSAEYDKIDQEQIKEVLGALNDGEVDNFYTRTNITIDEFVSEYLEGYTCK